MRLPLWKPPFETPFYEGEAQKPFAFAWIQWLNRIGQLFSQSFRTAAVTAGNYRAQAGDVIFASTGSGNVAITFPLSTQSQNGEITVTKVSNDANILSLVASGNDLIQGAVSQQTAVQWTTFRYGSDNAGNWFPV